MFTINFSGSQCLGTGMTGEGGTGMTEESVHRQHPQGVIPVRETGI
ncbi:hypothetical protein [Wolbachia endosymbiont (group B) of Limnophora tigrina]